MAKSKYTAPNDFRAFCEMLGETEASMCHHGVKGMHWGERKYQNPDGSLTEAGRKHYGYGEARKKKAEKEDASDKKAEEIEKAYSYDKTYTINDKLVKEAIKNAKEWDKNRTYDLHAGEKQAKKEMWGALPISFVLGASTGAYMSGLNPVVTAAGSIASGTVHAGVVAGLQARASIANHKLKKTIDEISANTNVDKKTGLKLKNTEMSYDQDMEMVNPGYKNLSNNTKNNCLICSATFALRRHGYDVTANGANDGYDRTAILQAFPKAKMNFYKLDRIPFSKEGQQKIIDTLGIPEGGYGYLGVKWQMGGGHALIYSVESGKPVIRDCQTNKTYRGSSINKILQNTSGESTVIRLDNVQPDIKQMKKIGLINPAGQNFNAAETPNVTVTGKTQNSNEPSKKHGDTGILSDLYNNAKFSYEINKVAKEKNKMLKAVPNKEFDASGMGFENNFKLSNAAYTSDTQDSPKYLKAIYSTTTKGKTGNDIMVAVGAKAENKDDNLKEAEKGMRQAAAILKQEASLYAQAKKGLANAKDDYSKEYFSKADLQNMSKNMKINRVEVNNGTKHPVVIFEATAKDGTTTLVDCEFKTLPNGQVILIDTKTGRDYF